MADFQYTTVPGKLDGLLNRIRETGVPQKAHNQWLKSIGFTSSNDSSLLNMLKFIGFADSSGIPTECWKSYRGQDHAQVLANAIRVGYNELYAVYPDAHVRTITELEHVFSTNSTAGKQVIVKTATTFQNLCKLADFSATGTTSLDKETEPPRAAGPGSSSASGQHIAGHRSPSLHIDIQVHISPDATADQIDQIFASMAKHLYKREDGS